MKRAMAFLACTSSSTYTKVAKIMKLPHTSISMVYQKTATLINTENDKAYCLHIKKNNLQYWQPWSQGLDKPAVNWCNCSRFCQHQFHNGRHGPHSPGNTAEWQIHLLYILAWFSRWKELNNEKVKEKRSTSTECNFFADKTWFCIMSLLLAARSGNAGTNVEHPGSRRACSQLREWCGNVKCPSGQRACGQLQQCCSNIERPGGQSRVCGWLWPWYNEHYAAKIGSLVKLKPRTLVFRRVPGYNN